MNRRDFLKRAAAAVAVVATGTAAAPVAAYPVAATFTDLSGQRGVHRFAAEDVHIRRALLGCAWNDGLYGTWGYRP